MFFLSLLLDDVVSYEADTFPLCKGEADVQVHQDALG